MINITNVPISQKNSYPNRKINFCGETCVEKLGKDVFVGLRKELIQETSFFREPDTLEFIKKYIQRMFTDKQEINILDGACSKGYETYTLAMMTDNCGKKINITGFDIGNNIIKEAKKGIFIIKEIAGDPDNCVLLDMHTAANNDTYLAFPTKAPLSEKEIEYKNLFNKFFTEIPYKKPKQTFWEWMVELALKKYNPHIAIKSYKINPDKADKCKFIQGDIMKLDQLVQPHKTDVLLFRNALYHLTTAENDVSYRAPLPQKRLIPTINQFVVQVDKAIGKNGLFVLGSHKSDHSEEVSSILYKNLKERGFEPVYYETKVPAIWKRE